MNQTQLRQQFYQHVFPAVANEWEVDEVVDDLGELNDAQQQMLLGAIPAVWPISHSLCFSVLEKSVRYVEHLDGYLLAKWIRHVLSQYELGGLKQARQFMEDNPPGHGFLSETSQVHLATHQSRISTFVKAICTQQIIVESGRECYTDTATIYLPERIDYFPSEDENLLWYRFMGAYQAVIVSLNTFSSSLFSSLPKSGFDASSHSCSGFNGLENRQLAEDLFQLGAMIKGANLLRTSFQGLMNKVAPLLRQLRSRHTAETEKSHSPQAIFDHILCCLSENRGLIHCHILIYSIFKEMYSLSCIRSMKIFSCAIPIILLFHSGL